MPRRPARTPKHETDRPASRRVRRGLVATATGTAVVAGALAVSGALSGATEAPSATGAALAAVNTPAGSSSDTGDTGDTGVTGVTDASVLAELDASRAEATVSRSATREAVTATKRDLLAVKAEPGPQVTRTRTVELGDPRSIAQAMLGDYGWGQDQFGCLESLWEKESGWDPTAANPTSSAYGIPQALPGSKMASAGADWATNPATQIEWGLGYIQGRYGSPCSAWGHSEANGWY